MGLGSRDYFRDGDGDMEWNSDAPAVRIIIITTLVALILQLVWTVPVPGGLDRESLLDRWLQMDTSAVLSGQIWRLVTYAFLHGLSPWHFIFNMLFLWWFGPTLERMYGTREFIAFYLSAAVAAALGGVAWDLSMQDSSKIVGASGAVLATTMLYTMHFPRQPIGLFFGLLTVEMRVLMAFLVFLDGFYALAQWGGRMGGTGVAHPAHLLGVAFGWAYFHFNWKITGLLNIFESLQERWKVYRARKRLKVFSPEPSSPLEEDVDRILAKIHEQGEASLTPKEREILTKASRAYRERR
ncbi:Rhomboid protease GluP [Planctopirus ephydatiae]|uniref:Rhomboid protease GluP n=1 Tax=Planctopirus ephydatiae TaxID=2528019 RepID=A0A518GPB5_9PLAN|nr:rhomboid family intramembrane serine protease [Planctopirus ephydatiae]QDV30463.1 Rhomboid protease GluP [Planctopirus ephydatiae]